MKMTIMAVKGDDQKVIKKQGKQGKQGKHGKQGKQGKLEKPLK